MAELHLLYCPSSAQGIGLFVEPQIQALANEELARTGTGIDLRGKLDVRLHLNDTE